MESKFAETRIGLRLNPSCIRRSQLQLAATLAGRQAEVAVGINLNSSPAIPQPLELLLSLERMLTGSGRPRLADRIGLAAFAGYRTGGVHDLVIDLSSEQKPAVQTSFRPLYDGIPNEAALFAALLAGRSPIIEIEVQPERRVIARGRPSLETGKSLNDFYEIIAQTVSDLLLTAIAGTTSPLEPDEHCPTNRLRSSQIPAYLIKSLKDMATTRLYRLCCFSPHWRVGWRYVSDQDVWDRMDLGGEPWKTLVNPGFRFLADPFPVTWQGETYVFVEDFDHRKGKGIISAIPFDASGPTAGPIPVLEEPWHLSYPFLFKDGDDIWMIPESSENREIAIYRAAGFPTKWVKEATLLQDVSANDTTIIRHEGRLWMFTTTSNAGKSADSLSIFTADRLLGPWIAHSRNPVLLDAAAARSGGNIVSRNGRLWRPVQDCRVRYGGALGLAEIIQLDDLNYRQRVRTILKPGAPWPGRRLHTLNRSGRLECIDGSANLIKLGLFNWAFEF